MKIKNSSTISSFEDVMLDSEVKGIIQIDALHAMIHQGKRFIHTQEEVIASGAKSVFLLTVPATGEIHFAFLVESSLLCTLQIYEAGDRLPSVTAIVGKNRERNKTNAPTLVITDEIATGGTTDGTLIYVKKWGTASAGGKEGGILHEDEFILKKSTKYLFVITSGANSNQVSTEFDWYETT